MTLGLRLYSTELEARRSDAAYRFGEAGLLSGVEGKDGKKRRVRQGGNKGSPRSVVSCPPEVILRAGAVDKPGLANMAFPILMYSSGAMRNSLGRG